MRSRRTLVLPSKAPAGLALSPNKPVAFITHPDAKPISVVDLEAWAVTATFSYSGMPFGVTASAEREDLRCRLERQQRCRDRRDVRQLGAHGNRWTRASSPGALRRWPDAGRSQSRKRQRKRHRCEELRGQSDHQRRPRAFFAVRISPDGKRALVGNVQGGTASLIDLDRLETVATERTGAGPHGVAFAPDGDTARRRQSGKRNRRGVWMEI